MNPTPPAKPYKTFPLWPHRSGSWCAVIDGLRRSFGGWRTDPKGDGALGRYNAFMEARRRGLDPVASDLSGVAVREVVNRYVTRQHRRAVAGEIGLRDYRDSLSVLEAFGLFVGRETRVAELRPSRFGEYRDELVNRGLSPSTIKRHLAHVKAMFRWAFDQEFIAAPPRYGNDFKPPRRVAARRKLLFSEGEVARMIGAAGLPLRAMIRLGVECGFGQTDAAALRWEDVDLSKRFIDLRRHKTGIARRCAISAALVADLKAWAEIQVKREVPRKDEGLTFTTLRGERYVREVAREDPLAAPLVVDSVALAFGKLMRDKLGIKSDGRGFYTLRRTHRTWTDELRDPHAAALVMGHAFGSVAGLYVQEVRDERLVAINEHVVKRLKGAEARNRRHAGPAGEPRPSPSSPAVAARTRRGRGGQFARSAAARRPRSRR